MTNGVEDAAEQRRFEAMSPSDQNRELFFIVRDISRKLNSLTRIVEGQGLRAWWLRLRDFLVFATPIAALAVIVFRGG